MGGRFTSSVKAEDNAQASGKRRRRIARADMERKARIQSRGERPCTLSVMAWTIGIRQPTTRRVRHQSRTGGMDWTIIRCAAALTVLKAQGGRWHSVKLRRSEARRAER